MITFFVFSAATLASFIMAAIQLFDLDVYDIVDDHAKWERRIRSTKTIVGICLFVGIVGMMASLSRFIEDVQAPDFNHMYKRGQVDALNGEQHYKATHVYHDSVLVDTLYTLIENDIDGD